jgi:anthranilate synthase component 1
VGFFILMRGTVLFSFTFDEFERLAADGNVVPVAQSFLADTLTPVSAFLRLRRSGTPSFLLESVEGGEKTGRYSFLGRNPFMTLRAWESRVEIERFGRREKVEGTIFDALQDAIRKHKPMRPSGLPRFTGGAVGYFSYDTVRLIERLPQRAPADLDYPDAEFGVYDTILAFDHLTHQILVITNVFIDQADGNLRECYDMALAKIDTVWRSLQRQADYQPRSRRSEGQVESNFTEKDFCDAVRRAKEYIRAGDIFQVVLSQRFQRPISVEPFDIYRALRVINPSPYLYYLEFGDRAIIGSSPELLVRVEDGVVEVRPIAGTRRRGHDEREDQALAEELLSDEKERAEHIMLVDLGRNDVGRVSEYGSVAVTELMEIERYSHVMHMVSNVRGRLSPGLDAIDAFKACFPAGTVTGAPKIRAMEIIDELEPSRRGIYAGALGYLDFSGNLDTCIAIRTILTQGGMAFFQAGAGIVADSVPEREYQETVHKARALREAIEFAERGLR